jgi:aminocarboxymuconate-semialdehyde decarboxylase
VLTGYGPTAARKHGRPGRDTRPRTTTIDIHSHVSVPAAAAIVEPYLDLSTIPLAFFSTPETKAVNAQQDAARRSRMSARGDGVTDRLRDLDRWGSIFRSLCRRRNATTRCQSTSA